MKYKYSNKNGYQSKLRHDKYDDIYSSEEKRPTKNYVDIYSSERKKDKFLNKVKWTKVFTFTFFLMLGIIGCLMLYAYKTLHSFNYDGNPVVVEEQEDLVNDSMVLNVLLIGSDSMSVGDGGRSDSMIILSLDARHKKIKLTSLMRDIWVTIPGHGQDRLNASYAFGGPLLTMETIAKNFGILIDRYAVVDFEGFLKIIDILGGVDLELTADECAYINKYSQDKHTLRGSGLKHLTGLQALHYSRDRNSIGSDYDRTSRQRNLLKALVSQMKSANIAQITEILAQIGPLVTTSFKTNEVSRMATHAMT
ncbi:MAG: LCP family protein [Clostridia bacterium]|nr:LCP family protein [Clostridia bacterium]